MYLNCHTSFSFKYGTLSVKQLLEKAREKQVNKLALTDINNTSGCIQLLSQAPHFGVHPVVGVDFRNESQQQFIGLAKNNLGFKQINEYLSCFLHSGDKFPDKAKKMDHVFVIYPFVKKQLKPLRENEFVGIRPSQVKKLMFSPWKNYQDKLVVMQPVTFGSLAEFETHRVLRAMHNNTLLSKLPKKQLAEPYEIMVEECRLEEIFADYPAIIRNTKNLLNQCSVNIDFTTLKNKKWFKNSEKEDARLLRKQCIKGLEYRYGKKVPSKVVKRMEKELQVIQDKKFACYFLINWDLVKYAREKNWYYVGRGSGANSMVAYLLRITDVDPIQLDLYFERFINPYRANLPDFDIDFSSIDRNDITRYLFQKYGADKTALLGTYNTFKPRGTIRELGKVYGMPDDEISKMQSVKSHYELDELGQKVMKHYDLIAGLPNHLSVHASGIVISEEPISAYTATMMPPKGFPTTHFSMIEAEDIGLHKFDILGQRGLGKIKDAVQLIKENRAVDVDIQQTEKFKKDVKINHQLLKNAKTIGCFYVESPAMRMLLTKLKASDYLRLVAASSIIRPGVAQSGMMQEYILRFHSKSRREKARKELPELYQILEETYGVMVYQEDVIKVAHYFAGLSLAEADVLRRGMSWKFRERNQFHQVKNKFVDNCLKSGHKKLTIDKLWSQIESFANYAFAKGHSASYAVESYQALYLKAYYPLEYLVATVNNGGGFYRTELYFHEAKMHGAKIEKPCINTSEGLTKIDGDVIFIGFRFIHGLELETINSILIERWENGRFTNLRNFVKRVKITLEQLRLLIRVGAFRSIKKQKKELLWDAHFLLSATKKSQPLGTLFNVEPPVFKIPNLWSHQLEDTFDEIELLGFPVNTSPFELIENLPNIQLKAKDLKTIHNSKTIQIVGYLIHVKRTQTRGKTQENMYFGTWIDREGAWIDTVHFPKVAKSHPFRGPGCYLITGKAINEFGFITIQVESLERVKNRNMSADSVRLQSRKNNYLKPRNTQSLH